MTSAIHSTKKISNAYHSLERTAVCARTRKEATVIPNPMAFVKAFAIVFCAGVAMGLAMAHQIMRHDTNHPI